MPSIEYFTYINVYLILSSNFHLFTKHSKHENINNNLNNKCLIKS